MIELPTNWAAGVRILVVGDVMLDRYVAGEASRLSEESPVPVLHMEAESFAPGGAANVAVNLATLGAQALLVGCLGDDGDADRLLALLASHPNLVACDLVRDRARPTTVKTRYLSGQHQLLRVDRESREPVPADVESAIISAALKAIPDCAAVILSDYAKGALTDRVLADVISAAQQSGAQVIVDPKRPDWSAYRGAHYLTPNRAELERATGVECADEPSRTRAAALAHEMTGASILLTRSQHGVSLYRPDEPEVTSNAITREVFDVTGAGDTVIAVFTIALAAGHDPVEAMSIANTAAGVVVTRRGAAHTTTSELAAALQESSSSGPHGGSLSLEQAKALRQAWRAENLTVGFANGCFDLLHPGHLHLIDQAAGACDRLIVAINSDASVARLKGPDRPIQSEPVRAAILAAQRGVDAVISFEEDTPLAAIEALEPDLLIKGEDYAEADIVGADYVRARGGRIMRARLLAGHSTSSTVQALKENSSRPGKSG